MLVLQKNKNDDYMHKITLCLLAIIMMLSVGNTIILKSKAITDSLADEVIRFHVVANSDTIEDQLLKQQVKDEIIAFMKPLLEKSQNIDETRMIIKDLLPEIKKIAQKKVQDYGKQYEIYVALDKANFPTKSYGDVVFPAGEYEACRVVIGEGKGENWWCVMYPPLCYIDASSGVVPVEGKEQLEKELSEEQYKLVNKKMGKRYQVRFKIVDTINSVFLKSDYKNKKENDK